ncbi:MAG TPA: HEAT repeat domain-containing protein [Gemmataceae bacterium]
MRRVSPVVSFFALIHFGTSLVGDESRGTKQPVNDLIKQLGDRDPDKVCAAARALGNLGLAKDAATALKELLKNPNGRVKWTAAEALWRLEHKATSLVPVYAELLTATDADARAASAWRLGRLGSDARPAVPVLAAALRDENLEVRVQVGLALANLGAEAEPALPALVRALGDERLDEVRTGDRGWENARTSPALPALVEMADRAIPLLIVTFREAPYGRQGQLDVETFGPVSWQLAGRAVYAFPAFGERAVGPLLQALNAKDASTRQYAARALAEIARFNGLPENALDKLEKSLDDPEKDVRRNAASAVSWVRPTSRKAVTILENARNGLDAGDLLGDLERMSPHNPAARKLLFHMLGDGDAKTAQEAHRILAGLELPAGQVLDAWTRALSHADSKVRSQAIAALRKLGSHAKSAKSTLRERFPKEHNSDCKGGILDALTAIDPEDPALVSLLIQSMDDDASWVRYRALECLQELGPRAKAAFPRLKAKLLNPEKKGKSDFWDDIDRRELVDAIVRVAPGSARTAATLIKALRHKDIRAVHDPKNSWFMRDKLEDHLQANLPAAAPLLQEALKDEDAEVRRSVALVLVRAGREVDAALPVLLEGLWNGKDASGEQSRFQRRVVELLSRRRSPTAPAVAAAWCKAWPTATPEVREVLEPGLLALQPESLPHLLQQLREAKTSKNTRDLAHLLASLEGQSKPIVPILREELREPSFVSQYAAAQALGKLGPDAAEAVPELTAVLRSSHPGIRAAAAQTLAGVGRAAKAAVPALKAMLKDTRPEMRIIAADALSRIHPDDSEALASLRDALVSKKDEGALHFRTDSIELPEGLKDSAVYPDSLEESIARFGERAVLVLADVLNNVDLDEWSAANVSSQCGAPARIQAALLLAKLGPNAQKAVPALRRALKDKDPFIRDAAASALGRIGPAAKEAAPDFISLLEEQNRFASAAGAWSSSPRARGNSRTANRFGYDGPFNFRSAGRSHLLSRGFGYVYSDPDPYGHLRPAYPYDPPYVLSRIDREPRSALPILREMARDPNHPGRLSAALALWRSGEDAPDLIPAFTDALQTQTRIARHETVPLTREMRECLAELDTQLKPAVGVMAEWLKRRGASAEERDVVAVAEALGRLGTAARAAADVLRPMLQDGRRNNRERAAAALALFRILGDRDLAFPVLREVLRGLEVHASLYYRPDPADSARVHAARALDVLAEKGDERASSLILETTKGDENPHVRVAALEAMARRKETNPAAIRGLCAMLRHPDAGVRIAAASACGRLGPLAKRSAMALNVATEDSHLDVRQAARQAMETLD